MRLAFVGFVTVIMICFSGNVEAQASQATTARSDSGYLIFSLTSDRYITNLFLDYSGTDGKNDDEASWYTLMLAPNDYEENGSGGIVYVKALPPGTYRFYHYGENDGAFVHNWRFSLPFTITPGEVTYAGDFAFTTIIRRNFLGLPVPDGGTIDVSDQKARDIPIAVRKSKQAGLADLPITVMEIGADAASHPPFVAPEKPN